MSQFSIVGLVASPRKGMNTDTLVSKALEGANQRGASVMKIYLNDLEIKPCQACGNPPPNVFCVFRDGMDEIYNLMESIDGIVIGSPAYYGSISSQLKLVIDRSTCLTEFVKFPDGKFTFKTKVKKHKKGLFIWVADSSRDPNHALVEVKGMFGGMNTELVDTVVVVDSDRGEGARNRGELLEKVFHLGELLVERIEKSETH